MIQPLNLAGNFKAAPARPAHAYLKFHLHCGHTKDIKKHRWSAFEGAPQAMKLQSKAV